ncbi:hypothetical protein FOCG_18160 [Fusarium oxysporum f. sp. radicis-lycopersici 26381]|nr:hypothetical protein FOCG_18160 [Fusarium oxysporum f. sp. radicis-lycopersici 26381]
MSHHKNSLTIVLPAQLYQEHPRASWWPRPLMLAMKQRKNPNSPDQAHRESAESTTGSRSRSSRPTSARSLRPTTAPSRWPTRNNMTLCSCKSRGRLTQRPAV